MKQDAFISETLTTILTQLGLPFSEITVTPEGKEILRVDIASAEPRKLIGWHGETLNSLQHLLKSILRAKEQGDTAVFVVLDCDNYRRDQEQKVRSIAEAKADFVRRTGHRIALPPMSPYFRRIVHLHVAATPGLEDLTTESMGNGDYRQVVMKLKNEKASGPKAGEELTPVMAKDDGLENLDI